MEVPRGRSKTAMTQLLCNKFWYTLCSQITPSRASSNLRPFRPKSSFRRSTSSP